ncbi:Por secretion system C-terminal sorting domain-containing protein [Tenacibaculum sp. MAR_2009_124]|uniref:fibronectin type III domain-containing protein n=1 Tax=Tenacibaculum sp. MAR_2009_124 TaxID=1250059 RepID=UPI00089C55C5|nr:fibronectin type III domain-containing protein [Tenacibaculum sp. MAR_2009_124]SEC81426.1 Por secretion system C-terminal sorting domain-containing protein [Tenacibaculum sp. MAR_2009_124]
MGNRSLIVLLSVFLTIGMYSQETWNCSSKEILELEKKKNPSLVENLKHYEGLVNSNINTNRTLAKLEGNIIKLPVVIHVLYNNDLENISYEQILSQLEVLNEDFRRTNPDRNDRWPQAGDMEIEFYLTEVDPDGNTSSGITRTFSSKAKWTWDDMQNHRMKKSSQGGVDPWDATEFLNIWICDIDDNYGGYATYPGGDPSVDGVVCNPNNWGSKDKGTGFYLQNGYDKGRTATHEMGHFLNLLHVWGDGGCESDDFVEDTPLASERHSICSTSTSTCGSLDMVENYMDYTQDACKNLFTEGQKTRMRAVLELGGPRYELAISDKTLNPECTATVPMNMAVFDITNSEVTLRWIHVPGAASYDVRYREIGTDEWVVENATTKNPTISGLSGFTQYEIQVRSNCPNGESSEYSESEEFTTLFDPCTVSVPQNITIANITTNEALVSWNSISGAGYQLRYREVNTANWIEQNVQENTKILNTLFSETTYEVQVRSICPDGTTSNYSNVKTFTTLTSCIATIPNTFSVTDVSPSSVKVDWNPVANVTFEIRYKAVEDSNWIVKTSATNSIVLINLLSSTQYEYEVRSICENGGASNFSNTNTFITGYAECQAIIPAGIQVSDITHTEALLSWNIVSEAVYEVRYRKQGALDWVIVSTQDNFLNLQGLESSTDYEFKVKSKCANGEVSDFSGNTEFTTLAPPCIIVVPSNIVSLNISATTATVKWEEIPSATYFFRYRVLGETSWETQNVATNEVNLVELLPATQYEFQVRSICANQGQSAFSSIDNLMTLELVVEYCESKGNNSSIEYIEDITVNDTSFNSSDDNGYADNTSIIMNLSKEYSNTLKITPKWTSAIWEEGYGVFIDYNGDGDFEDSNETVKVVQPTKDAKIEVEFTVPEWVSIAATRMRVVMRYNRIPSACGEYNFGETEDYTVNINSGDIDNEPPTPPTLSLEFAGTTSVQLKWEGATDNFAVATYDIFKNAVLIGTTSAKSWTVQDLEPDTEYFFEVKAKDAAGNVSEFSNKLFVITLSEVGYCSSESKTSSYEWIDYVSFGGMTNTTISDNGYGDYTNKIASVSRGSSYPIVFSAGYRTYEYLEYWMVWIDFNQDGVFSNTEKVVQGSSRSSDFISSDINIPETAMLGTTRIRVSMKWNEEAEPCEQFIYGEVEDYTVNISQLGGRTSYFKHQNYDVLEKSNTLKDFEIYENPVSDIINVNIFKNTSSEVSGSYKLINSIGKIVKSGLLSSQIDVQHLASGVYFLKIDDGQKQTTEKIIKK